MQCPGLQRPGLLNKIKIMYIKLISWYRNNKNCYSTKNNKNSDEYKEILSLTYFLNECYKNIPLSQRIWHLENNLEIQRCITCGNITNWKSGRGYSKNCGKNCLNKYLASDENSLKIRESTDYIVLIENYKKTCLERYGVDNYQKTKESTEKNIDTMRKLYGISNPMELEYFKNKMVLSNISNHNGVHNSTILGKKISNISFEKWKIFFENNGFEMISKIHNHSYNVVCKVCKNEFKFSTQRIYNNTNELCPYCNPNKFYSNQEKQLLEYIKSFYKHEIIENDRKQIKPYELDIWIPDLKLAIEFNGDYWHCNPKIYDEHDIILGKCVSEIWKKDEWKKDECINNNIKLITIWEYDWKFRNDIVKRYLKIIIQ